MKKIIIYSSRDEIISFPILYKILREKKFSNWKVDIILSQPKFLRKIKVMLVILFSCSFFQFYSLYKKKININQLKLKNVRIIDTPKKNYDFGISINYLLKLKKKKFKIFNFHLGNLYSQRGSFIFFYKYIYNWKSICLTCHEITEKFDTGKNLNEKNIRLKKKISTIEIMDLYNQNVNFILETIDLIKKQRTSKRILKKYLKLNYVPSIFTILKSIPSLIKSFD